MNKEVIKKYRNEFDHWLDGGEVYWYYKGQNEWLRLSPTESWTTEGIYVIKDKHFEARKAYALGEEIEVCYNLTQGTTGWKDNENPTWATNANYRPKPKTKTIVIEEWLVVSDEDDEYAIRWSDNIKLFCECNDWKQVKLLSTREEEIEE